MEARAPEPEAFPPQVPGVHGADGEAPTYVIADVDPLDVTGVRTVTVGTAIFLAGFLGLLPFTDDLEAADRLWWLWTCAAGVGLGLFGIYYCRRRARSAPRGLPDP